MSVVRGRIPGPPRGGPGGLSPLPRRYAVAALTTLAALLLAGSFFLPYWSMTLYAPQYPKGLTATIYLNKVTGDISELNILNHYIGMQPLDEAALLERQLSGFAIAALALLVFLFLFSGRRVAGWLAIPAVAFPIFFLASLGLWLYRFGHHLDPTAPIRIEPFMPALLGTGIVAQFRTQAMVSTGFILAVAAAAVLLWALRLRNQVCHSCPLAGRCTLMCPTGFLLEPRDSGEGDPA